MAIKFLETTQVGTIYNADEVAAFDPETEAELIKAKVAEAVEPIKEKGGKAAPEA
ncbi:hypothetical protein [Sphingomonas paucimobilis]|uniref:hypothetical protein n=1 Tax=Sphingomonas paucimobilis TaxID=13689 RepID=UPI000AE8B3F2|nr:hypothetical protein [Sphingomonas paucimobilis]